MYVNPQSVKSHFEKSMDKYDENAVVQIDLAEKLAARTAKIQKEFKSILELGCGTGILTRQIKEKLSFEKYYANDLVEKSKNYVSKIIPQAVFIHGNAQRIKPPQKVDLIISNAMFQWFSNLDGVPNYYKKFMNQDGILAFSTFGPENFAEIRGISGLSLNYLTKEQIIKALAPDFEILYQEEYTTVLEFESPPALLAHMKNTGVNALSAKIWTIAQVKDFCQKYPRKYDSTRLTYNPIIVTARLK